MIDMKIDKWSVVENFFFSVGNQKKLFHNFNTATHGATFNHVFEYFFDTVV
jgi:hypothetical protein